MEYLDLVEKKIGLFDIRNVDGKLLVPELHRFSEEAEILDTDLNNSKQNGLIRFLDKRISKLESSVNEAWNTRLTVESSGANEWMFLKAEVEKMTYNCDVDGCPASPFTNGQSFQRHLKKKHNLKRTVKMPTVTCRLPHNNGDDLQVADHQIASHLKIVHQIEKPSTSHFFRGFIRDRGVYSAVFLPEGAPDPTNPSNQDQGNTENAQSSPGVKTPEKEAPSQSQSNTVSPDFHGYEKKDDSTFKEVFKQSSHKFVCRDAMLHTPSYLERS